MKKIINKLGVATLIAAGAVVGGAAVAGVMAAIPDSNGTIHACYRTNNGSVRIIDNANSSCGSNETGLNWPSAAGGNAGPSQIVLTENGQVLGRILDANNYNVGGQHIVVFNDTLQRVVSLNYRVASDQPVVDAGYEVPLLFDSTDCTGTPWLAGDALTPLKTALFRLNLNENVSYWTVEDSTLPSIHTDGSASQDGQCVQRQGGATEGYSMTQVTLPFATPITGTLRFQ